MSENLLDKKGKKLPCDEKDCSKCREIIHLIVDCEACEEQMSHFKDSISKCQECMDYLNNHKNLLSIIKEKTGRKCCPEKIANAIIDSIKELHV